MRIFSAPPRVLFAVLCCFTLSVSAQAPVPRLLVAADGEAVHDHLSASDYLVPDSTVFIGGPNQPGGLTGAVAMGLFGIMGFAVGQGIENGRAQKKNIEGLEPLLPKLRLSMGPVFMSRLKAFQQGANGKNHFEFTIEQKDADMLMVPYLRFYVDKAQSAPQVQLGVRAWSENPRSSFPRERIYQMLVPDLRPFSNGTDGWLDQDAKELVKVVNRGFAFLGIIAVRDIAEVLPRKVDQSKSRKVSWRNNAQSAGTGWVVAESPDFVAVAPAYGTRTLDDRVWIIERSKVVE